MPEPWWKLRSEPLMLFFYRFRHALKASQMCRRITITPCMIRYYINTFAQRCGEMLKMGCVHSDDYSMCRADIKRGKSCGIKSCDSSADVQRKFEVSHMFLKKVFSE